MKISKGSALIVDQIKVKGKSWRDIAPTPLRKVLKRYENNEKAPIERIHFKNWGDYLVAELRGIRGTK